MKPRTLEIVHDGNWREFLSSDAAVLVLAISACPACGAWREELEAWLSDDSEWSGMRFGVIELDSPTAADFKKHNEWLDQVPGIPFTAVFVDGEPRTSLAGGGVTRLERRLENLSPVIEERAAEAQPTASFQQLGAEAPSHVNQF
jgi:hypothetical protein